MKVKSNKTLYWALIGTFVTLWLVVAFVSTLHAITFFQLTNALGLAILLGAAYEVGQASVLFSILRTKNKDKFLPWALMILLTGLQITANVYASFKYMITSGSTDWVYWQKSILFGVQAPNAEMYQIIISWIAGALLPVVALGMTALVSQNIRMMEEEKEEIVSKTRSIPDDEVEEIINNEVEKRVGEVLSSSRVTKVAEQPVEEKIMEDFKYVDDEANKLLDEWAEHYIPETPTHVVNVEPSQINIPEENNPEYSNEIINITSPEIMNDTVKTAEAETIVEPTIKKRGRPPKQNDDTAVVSKKEKELLPKEDVRVPEKRKRIVNPLNKKLDETINPQKGDEVINLIEKNQNDRIKESITFPDKGDVVNSQSLLVPPEILTPYLENGVEVIEAKAVPKPEVKKN